jgi:hypothetical protein
MRRQLVQLLPVILSGLPFSVVVILPACAALASHLTSYYNHKTSKITILYGFNVPAFIRLVLACLNDAIKQI